MKVRHTDESGKAEARYVGDGRIRKGYMGGGVWRFFGGRIRCGQREGGGRVEFVLFLSILLCCVQVCRSMMTAVPHILLYCVGVLQWRVSYFDRAA
jgi:hypothetical protein